MTVLTGIKEPQKTHTKQQANATAEVIIDDGDRLPDANRWKLLGKRFNFLE